MAIYRIRFGRHGYDLEIEAESLEDLLTAVQAARASGLDTKLADAIPREEKRGTAKRPPKSSEGGDSNQRGDLVNIVNAVKDSEDFPRLESAILNGKGEFPRVLLACYFASRTHDPYLSSSNVETITNELGVRIKASNVNRSFVGKNSKYFTADRVRRKGVAVRYKLNRAGEQAFEALIRPSGLQSGSGG